MSSALDVNRVFITNIEPPENRSEYNIDYINLMGDHFGMSPKDFLPEDPLL